MLEPYKVLFLEDKTTDISLMQAELSLAGINSISQAVSDEPDFISATKNFDPDIILASYSLDKYSGIQAFKTLDTNKLRPAFIILTDGENEEVALESCKEGVEDVISRSDYKNLPDSILKAVEKRKKEIAKDKVIIDLLKRNKELEEFAYMISHNLGGSVANIKGLFDIWDPDKRTKHEQKYIYAGLKFSIQKLDEVIKDINTILQVKEQIKESKQFVKFDTLVNDIKLSHYTIIRKSKVRIKTNFAEVDGLLSNKGYLNSIFYNLISNSIKYCKPDESPKISIVSKRVGDQVELIFTDNGIGINMAEHGSKIFELYKRIDQTQEGKGMGLFLVKSQVEALSGTIEVKSELNKGCEFILRFPIVSIKLN